MNDKGCLVAGADLSLSSTGLVILELKSGNVVEKRTIRAKGKGILRCQWLRDHLCHELRQKAVDLVAVEGYAYGMRGRAIYSLGELGGILRLGLIEAGLRWVDVPPATLKLFVTGKGNAAKDAMMLSVYKRWGVSCENADEADAYGLAQLARAFLGHGQLTSFQERALSKVKAVKEAAS